MRQVGFVESELSDPETGSIPKTFFGQKWKTLKMADTTIQAALQPAIQTQLPTSIMCSHIHSQSNTTATFSLSGHGGLHGGMVASNSVSD